MAFAADVGSQNGAQNDPKLSRKRDKTQDEKCITVLSLLELSWSDLGSILDLVWGQKSCFSNSFTAVLRKYTFSKKERFKTHFGPNLARFDLPKRGQDEPKTSPKRIKNRVQNRSEKRIPKWTAQSCMPGFGYHTFGSRGPPGGG